MCGEKIPNHGALHLRHTIGRDSVSWPITHTISGSDHSTYATDQWTSDIDTVLFQCWAGGSQLSIFNKFCSLAVGDHVITHCLYVHLNSKAKRQYLLTLQGSRYFLCKQITYYSLLFGEGWAVGIYPPCHISLYPLQLCNRLHCDIKTKSGLTVE